jgi:hypothetical protein
MPEKVTKTIAYLASSLNTLDDLQRSCNRDEAFLGKVVNIELASIDTQSGAKAVAITYEKLPLGSGVYLGHLRLQSFKDAAEENSRKTELLLSGATAVLPGSGPDNDNSKSRAFIQNDVVQFLIFRDKRLG